MSRIHEISECVRNGHHETLGFVNPKISIIWVRVLRQYLDKSEFTKPRVSWKTDRYTVLTHKLQWARRRTGATLPPSLLKNLFPVRVKGSTEEERPNLIVNREKTAPTTKRCSLWQRESISTEHDPQLIISLSTSVESDYLRSWESMEQKKRPDGGSPRRAPHATAELVDKRDILHCFFIIISCICMLWCIVLLFSVTVSQKEDKHRGLMRIVEWTKSMCLICNFH